MPRQHDKPGPKSSKRHLKKKVTLDETSESVEDDETIIPSRFEKVRTRSDFQTPTRDYDATDYGLEFTSSQLNISPRRCSTVRPESRRPITQQEPTPQQIGDQSRGNTAGLVQPTSRPQERPTTSKKTAKSRRKQMNPMRKEQCFWKEVNRLANSDHFLIPRLPFSRLVREILLQRTQEITHMSRDALEALQTSAEMYITQRLQDAYLLTLHRSRVTLTVPDLQLINFLFGNM